MLEFSEKSERQYTRFDKVALAAAVSIFLVLLVVWYYVGLWYQEHTLEDQYSLAENHLVELQGKATSMIRHREAALTALAVFADFSDSLGSLNRENLNTFAGKLLADYPDVLSCRITIGDRFDFNFQNQSAKFSADSGKNDLLLQKKFNQLPGTASITMSLNGFVKVAGLDPNLSGLQIALGRDSDHVIWGEISLFEKHRLVRRISIPGGELMLAFGPQQEWLDTVQQRVLTYNRFGLVAILLVSIVIYLAIRRNNHLKAVVQKNAANLAESEHRYRQLFDLNSDALFVIETSGKIHHANEMAVNRYGYSLSEILEMNVMDLAGEEMRDKTSERLGTAKNQKIQFYWVHRRKNGLEFPVEINTRPVELEGKQYIFSTVRDITARRRAEAALIEQEKFLQELLATSPAVIFKGDYKGNVQYVSNNIERLTGYQPSQFTEDPTFWPRQIHREDVKSFILKFKEISPEATSSLEYRIKHRDGHYRWIYQSLSGQPSKDDQDFEVIGSVVDITDKKIFEIALKTSEANLQKAFEIAAIGTWKFDIRNDRYEWNESAIEVIGFESREVPQSWSDFLKFVHPDDQESLLKAIERANSEGFLDLEHRLIIHGEVKWVRVGSNVDFNKRGVPVSSTGIIQDITEKQKYIEELEISGQQIKELARHLQIVREEERAAIARAIHDEFGQVISVIKMEVSIIEDEITPLIQGGRLKVFVDNINDIYDLIDRSLGNLNKLIAQLRPDTLDTLGLIAALEWQMEELQKRSGIKCQFRSQIDKLSYSAEKEIALYRILQEALTNIIRHSGADLVRVDIIRQAKTVKITIADNGKGLSADLQKTKRFGLLGMKENAMILGAEIEISGELGQGTAIVLNIPEEKNILQSAPKTV